MEAKRLLGLIVSGLDPGAHQTEKPETVSQLCDDYMDAAWSGAILTRFNRPKKASTLEIDRGRISRHIKPLIGHLKVTEIHSRTVRRMIDDITVGKTAVTLKTKVRGKAIVKGGAATAARVADLLSGIMTWAIEQGIISQNPVHRVRRFRSEPRQRFLSTEELAKLGAVLERGADETGKPIHPHAISIIRLVCLTGCRLGEITGLAWDELDLELGCLRLEDTKTGRSLRPIGRAAREAFAELPSVVDVRFVFPGRTNEAAYQGIGKEARCIFKAADLKNATPHVLRHTFASVASELGYSDGTIAGLLGHKGRGTTSRYVHRPDQALAFAADAVSAEIGRHLRGSSLA